MLEKGNIFLFLILAIHPDLSVGSLVQFPLDGMKIQGVIKWIGCVDGRTELLAGLELVILSLYIWLLTIIYFILLVNWFTFNYKFACGKFSQIFVVVSII